MYSFLEEDFSHEGKAGKDLRRVPLPGEFVKKELRQKEGPYFLLQKTILHVGSGKPLINRMEFVSAEEETPHDP